MEQLYLMPGEERYTKFRDENGVPKIRYTYCSLHGKLFNCVCRSTDEAQRLCEDFCDLLPKLFQRRITHMECPFPALRFFVQKLVQKMLPIIYKCFGDNVAVRIFILTRMNRAIVEAKNFSIRHSEENG